MSLNVDIILATYNGEKYIKEQINSICHQTYENWNIIITDDGSTDSTLQIIHEQVKELGIEQKVTILERRDDFFAPGPAGNFIYGLSKSEADLIMFSDQDDYWLPEKIEKQVYSMLRTELSIPTLSFCDAQVVDEKLNLLYSSFISSEGFSYEHPQSINKLLFQNVAPGCCMIINKKLKVLLLSKMSDSSYMVMHDWYLMILANLFGKILTVPEALMLYRQHSSNQVGASKKVNLFSLSVFYRKLKKSIDNHKNAKSQFNHIYKVYCTDIENEMLDELNTSLSKGYLTKVYTMFKYRFRKSTLAKTLMLYILV